jgi:hypothetical protein
VRYKTSSWDALILQAAEQSGAAQTMSTQILLFGSQVVKKPFAT